MMSEFKIKTHEWVHVAFVLEYDMITEANLYINGKLDSQMAIGSTLKATKGNLYFGQNPYSEGFVGEIGDAYYYFYAL